MNMRYRITLTVDERDELRSFALAGKGAFRRLKRAVDLPVHPPPPFG